MTGSTSWLGIKQVAAREACVLVWYSDDTLGGNRGSFGFGSQTGNPQPGATITIEEAFIRLKADIASRDLEMAKYLTRPILQQEWDALASLYYQAGTAALKSVANYFNLGLSAIATAHFMDWAHGADGVQRPGHIKRRIREMAIAEFGEYGPLDTFLVFDGNPRLVAPRTVPFPAET